jgi:fibrillarin-like pre-rRNA processing protein
MKEVFPGVFLINRKPAVENSVPGYRPFDEEIVKVERREFRVWEPTRSKLGAALVKGIKEFPIRSDSKILYLGAAHGFTVSFISNVLTDKNGIIYAVEFSERCFKELIPLTQKYKNIAPIMADARKTELYSWIEKVDVVFCDISQPDETEIAIRNCKEFLKPKGYLMLSIKSRSIDITKSPTKVYHEEIEKLKKAGFEIVDWKTLDPLERAHAFILARL